MLTTEIIHYFAVILSVSLASIGTGLGQGFSVFGVMSALSRQEEGNDHVFRTMVIGLAFIESGVILALVISLMFLFSGNVRLTSGMAIAELGIAIMMGIVATAIGIASSYAVRSSAISVGRQPFFSQKILTLMLVTQSLMETPVVFAFVVGLIIKSKFAMITTVPLGFKYFAAASCLTLGSIGPAIGQGLFAKASCKAVGLNKKAYSKLLPFAIINGAVIQTPIIFSLLLSILIIFYALPKNPVGTVISFLIIAFTIGAGSLGTAVGAGFVGSKTVKRIALDVDNYSVLFRSNILAQAFIESSVIYTLIVSLAILGQKF